MLLERNTWIIIKIPSQEGVLGRSQNRIELGRYEDVIFVAVPWTPDPRMHNSKYWFLSEWSYMCSRSGIHRLWTVQVQLEFGMNILAVQTFIVQTLDVKGLWIPDTGGVCTCKEGYEGIRCEQTKCHKAMALSRKTGRCIDVDQFIMKG